MEPRSRPPPVAPAHRFPPPAGGVGATLAAAGSGPSKEPAPNRMPIRPAARGDPKRTWHYFGGSDRRTLVFQGFLRSEPRKSAISGPNRRNLVKHGSGLFRCRPGNRRMLMLVWTFCFRRGLVPAMTTLATPASLIDLRAGTVRPTRGARAHRLRDRRGKESPYLRFPGILGKGLRPVALPGETRVARVGGQPVACTLAARDRGIGGTAEPQFRRRHRIAHPSRFVLPNPRERPNPASRVLGPSLRRRFADLEAAPGDPVFPAETFVDVSRFAGTCDRAANGRSPGRPRARRLRALPSLRPAPGLSIARC